jgi:hypothetical protein
VKIQILPFKKLQLFGSAIMICSLVYMGPAQSFLFLIGSILILASMLIRMYLIHVVFRIPVSNNVLSYLFIPMLSFLCVDLLTGYQPIGVSAGMWYYLLVWSAAVLGASIFIHSITRRLLALPWRGQDHK